MVEVAKEYVCVRVTDMRGVDLNTYVFDYDLTFAALLMNADGTIYHRFGGRDAGSASGRLSMKALVRLLKDGLEDHAAYAKAPRPPVAKPARTLEGIPPFAARLAKNPNVSCLHCHMVNDAERELAVTEKRWKNEDSWRWPIPEQAGLTLDVDDPALLKTIAPKSAADAAGLKAGDRLVSLGGQRIRSLADVQWTLDRTPFAGGSLEVAFERSGETKISAMSLANAWRQPTPLEFSWRPSMWGLRPDPGFGGTDLTADEKKTSGLAPGAFAFRIGYLIDWGDHPEAGKNARAAGLRKDDVLISADGISDFAGHQHFQSWFRLTRKAGDTAEFVVLREGRRETVRMPVIP